MPDEEQIPFIQFDTGEEQYEATPYNSRLFTFIGKVASGEFEDDLSHRNCVVIEEPLEDDEDGSRAIIIFEKEIVQQAGMIMLRKEFPASLNNREVPKFIEDGFLKYLGSGVVNFSEYFNPGEWGGNDDGNAA